MTAIYEVVSKLAQEDFYVAELCEVLDVSRSAFYGWRDSSPNAYQLQDQKLEPSVKQVFYQHRRRYGSRRIAVECTQQGIACSRRKASKIMTQLGLIAIQPKSFKPRSTESKHKLGYSPNLLLDGVDLTAINQVWVGDITYISAGGGYHYLAVLMDLFSRKIIGWQLDDNMETPLVLATLKQAIKARQPEPGMIHHTDRGGQYAATIYRSLLKRSQMTQSMSRAGDCYDNAFMESCFGTIKAELEMTGYSSFTKAKRVIQEYVNYYNVLRRHSSIHYQSPNRFEENSHS